MYVSLGLGNNDELFSSLENLKHCIEEIWLWMTQNMIKLNDDTNTRARYIGESCINPSSTVRNIGVLFDKYLTMSDVETPWVH